MELRNYLSKISARLALLIASTTLSLFLSCDETPLHQGKRLPPKKLNESFQSNLQPKTSNLEQRISQEPIGTKGKPDKYGVLISGANEARYQLDLTLIYQILLESGFKKENIYILDEHGREEFLYPTDGKATKANIENLFSHLEKKVDAEDLLVVHISDHGDTTRVKNKSSNLGEYQKVTEVSLPGENITELDLERYLSGIQPQIGIVTTDVCFGGGIARRIGNGKYIGISASEENEEAHEEPRDSFGGFFYQAFRNFKASDKNQDGKVSLDEAFNYAKSNHSWTKNGNDTPLLKSDLDVTQITIN